MTLAPGHRLARNHGFADPAHRKNPLGDIESDCRYPDHGRPLSPECSTHTRVSLLTKPVGRPSRYRCSGGRSGSDGYPNGRLIAWPSAPLYALDGVFVSATRRALQPIPSVGVLPRTTPWTALR